MLQLDLLKEIINIIMFIKNNFFRFAVYHHLSTWPCDYTTSKNAACQSVKTERKHGQGTVNLPPEFFLQLCALRCFSDEMGSSMSVTVYVSVWQLSVLVFLAKRLWSDRQTDRQKAKAVIKQKSGVRRSLLAFFPKKEKVDAVF